MSISAYLWFETSQNSCQPSDDVSREWLSVFLNIHTLIYIWIWFSHLQCMPRLITSLCGLWGDLTRCYWRQMAFEYCPSAVVYWSTIMTRNGGTHSCSYLPGYPQYQWLNKNIQVVIYTDISYQWSEDVVKWIFLISTYVYDSIDDKYPWPGYIKIPHTMMISTCIPFVVYWQQFEFQLNFHSKTIFSVYVTVLNHF